MKRIEEIKVEEEAREGVGERLRRLREERGLTRRDVALALRLRERVIEGIESGGGVGGGEALPPMNFAKGFVRCYGSFLGCDGNELADCFEKERGGEKGEEEVVVMRESSDPRSFIAPGGWAVGGVCVVLVLLLGVWVFGGEGEEGGAVAEGGEEVRDRQESVDVEKWQVEEQARDEDVVVEVVEEEEVEEVKGVGVKEEGKEEVAEGGEVGVKGVRGSRFVLVAKSDVGVVVRKGEEEVIFEGRVGRGERVGLPEGRRYILLLEGGEWGDVYFEVDGMRADDLLGGEEGLILDGYGVASGRYEWWSR